ncbi:nuclear transport factor 2 family protein [bacterium M00.F.Ca.ET.228.01.1.1]|uniref:nuclear transport factor 2 family protein n=1 Tax=Paraburkholderia phenoliruptrix TaxID=252970 RepID=UPI0010924510|nr:nuclear transport factor 2 family protein [Paraburkholderia phenoliruptrix]TGP47781.1 nuclear transport factor 2 family protein [bacterium M00.F.Ca.ET.228.01.1.1]TGS05573.1 nuclear transport factor 2 family protein [bacterium M00.F.Ca.ET.191.01.1.1]TGU10509.1 nuclear transport factor 2 family protein [bacterium M00.F.Ca.ET.155.01.1.1]MBW0445421.1 nuclear transport factor 2 family protein [Paraburkholderia phenoliruptrix]MBW9096186.1 nuclear transport factor 2 family protein [Paraburkholderi
MNSYTDLIDRYFAAWNETDGARRRELIASTWASDADYRDPLMTGSGHDGIDAMIRAVQERFAGHTFRRSTDVDSFGNRLRFSWELLTPAGEAIVKGSDFGTVDARGRLQSMTGFLDQVPAGAQA